MHAWIFTADNGFLQVEFEEFNVRLDGWLGLNLPQQLPQVT